MITAELADRKLKAKLDFFKIYSVFVIGLVTGNVNLLNSYLEKDKLSSLVLLIFGILVLIIFFIAFLQSIVKIESLIK